MITLPLALVSLIAQIVVAQTVSSPWLVGSIIVTTIIAIFKGLELAEDYQ